MTDRLAMRRQGGWSLLEAATLLAVAGLFGVMLWNLLPVLRQAGGAAGVSSSVATTSMPSATLRLDTISASGPSASRTRRMTSRLLAATKRLSFIRHCLQ
ncbi:hypothetical protein [Bordetella bronchiseptica]|uniref:hypothetical protein n=1 Tax=Bordetella bronchiseptica TaxID=518 RepID=UPI003EDC8406